MQHLPHGLKPCWSDLFRAQRSWRSANRTMSHSRSWLGRGATNITNGELSGELSGESSVDRQAYEERRRAAEMAHKAALLTETSRNMLEAFESNCRVAIAQPGGKKRKKKKKNKNNIKTKAGKWTQLKLRLAVVISFKLIFRHMTSIRGRVVVVSELSQ